MRPLLFLLIAFVVGILVVSLLPATLNADDGNADTILVSCQGGGTIVGLVTTAPLRVVAAVRPLQRIAAVKPVRRLITIKPIRRAAGVILDRQPLRKAVRVVGAVLGR